MISFLSFKESSSHLFAPVNEFSTSTSSASFFCANDQLDEIFHSVSAAENSLSLSPSSSSALKELLTISLNTSSFLFAVDNKNWKERKQAEGENMWNVNDYIHRLLLSSIPSDALSMDEVKTDVIKSDLSVTQDSFSPGFPSSSRLLSSASLGSATLPSAAGLSSAKGLSVSSFL
jgi:hypothetical protein